ncbi:putative membrane-associated Zn-dependent protease [Halobacteroides halobius DSM 5150]|uniref:Zinc metalloprotease n=1 Tax=Halobacteroides halobius (strain ATCC 35273 / DSM 5150 / MD-1) TaxID=748449 RepID=L0K6L1_HALHC|nr:RIP metalloprotease RseP [Halobacteroides halobius]AGB40666.1 putative membrane-associated Zn-dependent protease [Halobacteroides halobius DSM 5150]
MLTTIVSFIVVLSILVFFHELGHFLVAKYVGVQVEEFAIGMGPKLIGHQQGETLYSIRILPLGGFCKMTGEMPVDDEESDPEEIKLYQQAVKKGKCLFQKSVLERISVITMGPIMNFLLAAVLFMLIFNIFGIPVDTSSSTIIGQVVPEGPAYRAGLKEGDKILAINNKPVDDWKAMAKIIHQHPKEEISLKVLRGQEILNLKVTPRLDENRKVGLIGIIPILKREPVNLFKSIILGIKQTGMYIFALVMGLWKMITQQMSAQVSGPVKIAQMVGNATESGMMRLMRLSAIISINLGIMNLLPFPALDGGRLVFLGVELVRGEPVDPEKEGVVHLIGFVLLMLLFVFIMIKDIKSII